jgi:hypothetical protein
LQALIADTRQRAKRLHLVEEIVGHMPVSVFSIRIQCRYC